MMNPSERGVDEENEVIVSSYTRFAPRFEGFPFWQEAAGSGLGKGAIW